MNARTTSLLSIFTLIALSQVAVAGPTADANKLKAERLALANAKTKYTKAKAAYAKKPKDAKLKKGYIDAAVAYGTTTMNSGALTPREKYPIALAVYREVLKLDPKNKEALNNSKMIEEIYKSMGRPVPK